MSKLVVFVEKKFKACFISIVPNNKEVYLKIIEGNFFLLTVKNVWQVLWVLIVELEI